VNRLLEIFGACSPIASVAAVLFFVAPFAGEAQPAGKVHRIGFLGNSTAALEAHLVGPFREGLRELGYVEGQNIVIEYRWAEGKYERFPRLIAELLAQKVELIVTAGTPASLAVKKATTSVPLVMVGVGDPVDTGLVASLKQPGGNVTGLTSIADETEGKKLELLREVLPTLSRIAVLSNPENQSMEAVLKEMRAAAQVLGMKVRVFDVRTSGELDETFKAIVRERPGVLRVMGDRLFLHNRQRIMDFATKQRLPVVPGHPELVEAGGLMSFGPSYPGMHRRAAYFVDRILKGTKPADLPVERPTKFELVVNLKAAKALGLKIPASLLQRADQVIE
jgi:putative tryptophan/tyrosine transport system substrate-binding protein